MEELFSDDWTCPAVLLSYSTCSDPKPRNQWFHNWNWKLFYLPDQSEKFKADCATLPRQKLIGTIGTVTHSGGTDTSRSILMPPSGGRRHPQDPARFLAVGKCGTNSSPRTNHHEVQSSKFWEREFKGILKCCKTLKPWEEASTGGFDLCSFTWSHM